QPELVTQKPQQRHRRIAVERALLSIHFYGDHEFLRWRVSGATELPPLSAWRCLELAASRRSAPHAVSEAGGFWLLAVSRQLERVWCEERVIAELVDQRMLTSCDSFARRFEGEHVLAACCPLFA